MQMPPTTDLQIETLVNSFYNKVRADCLLGPIFEAAIEDNWDAHLTKMRAFWSTVMLASRTYKGNPMITHLLLPRLSREHFGRWLELWRETTSEICDEPAAALFRQKAALIAERLLQTIDLHHDGIFAQAALQRQMETA